MVFKGTIVSIGIAGYEKIKACAMAPATIIVRPPARRRFGY
jgi:hypothetical protein